jgi:WD40 repeat protein
MINVCIGSNYVASGSIDRSLRLWNLGTGQLVSTLHIDAECLAIAIMGPGRIVVGDDFGRLHVIEIAPPSDEAEHLTV